MKKISKILIFLFLSTVAFTSCNDLLDVDSEREVFPDEFQMNAANDSLYSMFGIFSQLQKITDSYLLLGELRGDLLDVNGLSNPNLTEINNFDFSKNNPYANNLKDYYAVINNCNYVIHNIDTTKLKGAIPVFTRIYAATKAIRAWTYMQIAYNFGKVVYYDLPILSLDDAQKSYPIYNSIEELAPVLIADIAPFKDVDSPQLDDYGDGLNKYSFFPIRFLLGDLYLNLGQYEQAATEYHDLIYKGGYQVYQNKNTHQVIANEFTGNYDNMSWDNYLISVNSAINITSIGVSNQYSHNTDLDSIYFNQQIVPSDISIKNWDSQMYYVSEQLDTIGDLRKIYSVGTKTASASSLGYSLYSSAFEYNNLKQNFVLKYHLMRNSTTNELKLIMPYRSDLLYLRYAEAVNRLGKPYLAMAVLKHGLNKSNIENNRIVPQSERPSPLPNYMDFTHETRFKFNIGVRMHGCGNVDKDTIYFVIPKFASTDSLVNRDSAIVFVEDLIVQELALETAFEGNRFQDLMRVATRRNDNAYLAEKVAAKHKNNKEAIKSKLLNRQNWFVKFE